jgi:hypothetical protein
MLAAYSAAVQLNYHFMAAMLPRLLLCMLVACCHALFLRNHTYPLAYVFYFIGAVASPLIVPCMYVWYRNSGASIHLGVCDVFERRLDLVLHSSLSLLGVFFAGGTANNIWSSVEGVHLISCFITFSG